MPTANVAKSTCNSAMCPICNQEQPAVEPANTQIYSPTLEIDRFAVDYERVKWLGRELLLAIGEDPDRGGLQETPRRFADWWREFIDYDPGKVETIFSSVEADQMIVVTGIKVWSLCEHHLLPFWCNISVGYIPEGYLLGLSKFARIAHKYAHSLQVQERLVQQIADEVVRQAKTESVAVLAIGEHLCQTIRGIKTPGMMKSSVMRGSFRQYSEVRAEFLSMVEL